MRAMAAAATAALLGGCSGFSDRAQEKFHQAIASSAVPIVHVDNIAGSVRIDPSTKSFVDVAATKYGYDEAELRNITIGIHRDGDNVFIVTTYNDGGHGGGVRYHIFVPANASVQVGNVAGTVTVGAVAGNVGVRTQAGTIDVSCGRVAGDRTINLRATTGTVTLRIAGDSSAGVDAESTVGSFSSDFPSVVENRENLVGARAVGKIGSGSATIRLTTTTGSISLLRE